MAFYTIDQGVGNLLGNICLSKLSRTPDDDGIPTDPQLVLELTGDATQGRGRPLAKGVPSAIANVDQVVAPSALHQGLGPGQAPSPSVEDWSVLHKCPLFRNMACNQHPYCTHSLGERMPGDGCASPPGGKCSSGPIRTDPIRGSPPSFSGGSLVERIRCHQARAVERGFHPPVPMGCSECCPGHPGRGRP